MTKPGALILLVLLLMPFGALPIDKEERAAALDTCLGCHVDTASVVDIFYSPHGSGSDPHSPMNQGQCASCHGNNDAHLSDPDILMPEITFTSNSALAAEKQNDACLHCHNDSARMHWVGDAHARHQVRCVDCHTVHARRDPILNHIGESKTCTSCHLDVRDQMAKVSTHPMSKAGMSCSSCHAAHGSLTQSALKLPTLNQACYQCHADRRGPFLWEHAPVREQCIHCHLPHGSNHQGMLRTRAPFLCQQCHSTAEHPSTELLPEGTNAASSNSIFLLVRGCLSCHSAVHGSNHPSGVKLMR